MSHSVIVGKRGSNIPTFVWAEQDCANIDISGGSTGQDKSQLEFSQPGEEEPKKVNKLQENNQVHLESRNEVNLPGSNIK